MVKKKIRIGFNTNLNIWILYVPSNFEKPFCSSCLNDIDKEKPFYFCRRSQRFYCSKCMFKINISCPGVEKEQEHLCIQKVEQEPEVKK